MSDGSDPRWDDPRDRDDETRDVEAHWIELERGPTSERRPENDARGRDEERDRAREHDPRERGHVPRDVFLDGLELPRGPGRGIVLDGGHPYELKGEESRTLAVAGGRSILAWPRNFCEFLEPA